MYSLDWGQITPESANLETNVFTYVYNHDLTSDEKVSRTIRFVIGRLNYYDNHLPKDPFHSIIFDIRGQQINNLISDYIIEEIKNKYPRPNSLKIDFVNQ